MKIGKTPNRNQDREQAGLFARLRDLPRSIAAAKGYRAKILAIAGFWDAIVASRAGKYIPAAVLAASLATTVHLYRNEKEAVDKDFESRIRVQAVEIEHAITMKIRSYEQLLMGVRWNFDASEHVSPEEFSEYVAALKLKDTHPEIRGISVSYYLPGDELGLHVQNDGKTPSYYVEKLEKWLPEYAPVAMIEPRSNDNARVLGFDNFRSPERKAVMGRARDLDSIQMTPMVPLAQNGSDRMEPWAILFLPIYWKWRPRESVEERRTNVVGWVAASFFMNDFMNAALSRRSEYLAIRIYDAPSTDVRHLVYDSTTSGLRGAFDSVAPDSRSLSVASRQWTLVSYPKEAIAVSVHFDRPVTVAAFWTVVSFLLTFFFWMSIHGRWSMVAALEALKISSSNLLESEKRYRALFRDSKVPMLVVDPHSGNIVDANDEAVKFYGYPLETLRSMNIGSISTISRETVQERLSLVRNGLLERFETEHLTAYGETRLVEVSASPIDMGGEDGILQIVTDVTDRNIAVEKIMKMATYDELTGLPNRNLLMDRLSQAFANADRNGHNVALLFIDLDQFKAVNDSIGHDVGDLLLKEVACRMVGVVRAQDTVARMGGDEFLVILPDLTDASHAALVAEKLIAAISQSFSVKGHVLHIGASIGIASYPNDAGDGRTIMKFADSAMYEVKNSGRNSYRFFSKDMHEASMEHQKIASALHDALERNEMSLQYQPLVNVRSWKTIGMEALLRWNNPELGNVSPAKFIPIAEDSGRIVPIGEWVIREACRTVAEWKSRGLEPPRIAINLSARQFRLKTLADDVVRIMSETGTETRHIGFEITEGMLIEDVASAVATLEKLASLGFEVSVDDFWTGYSSLSYLKRFPLKKLKIDRSFVNDIVSDPDDVVIVRSIVDLAHNLGLRVVAEGVENEDQFAMLREMGCDCAQGYLFSRPIAADEMCARLEAEKLSSLAKKTAQAASQILTTEKS